MKDRRLAFITRLGSFGVALSGLFLGSGFQKGMKRFLFYTQQSNILAAGLFLFLAVRTLIDLVRRGKKGSVDYCPAPEMACTLTIAFTFIIYWFALAPFAKGTAVLSWGNFALHAFTPLLTVFDYVFFCERGKLKKRHIFLSCIIPLAYVVESTVLGLCGTVFYVYQGLDRCFPYYFMDYGLIGWYAALFTALIGAVFCLSAAFIYRLDSKSRQRDYKTAK